MAHGFPTGEVLSGVSRGLDKPPLGLPRRQAAEDREFTIGQRERLVEQQGIADEFQEFEREYKKAVGIFISSGGTVHQPMTDIFNKSFGDLGSVDLRRDEDGTFTRQITMPDGKTDEKSGLTFDQVGLEAVGPLDVNAFFEGRQSAKAAATKAKAEVEKQKRGLAGKRDVAVIGAGAKLLTAQETGAIKIKVAEIAAAAKKAAAKTGTLWKSADANSIMRFSAGLFSGTFDPLTQEFAALTPDQAQRALAIGARAARIFVDSGGTILHQEAVEQAARESGIEIEAVGPQTQTQDNPAPDNTVVSLPDGTRLIKQNGQWVPLDAAT